MLEKLGLGTVQFGQAYGVSNMRGQVPKAEAAAILDRAAKAGIRLLDTAANYGDAETVLAALNTAPFPHRHQDHRTEAWPGCGGRPRAAIGDSAEGPTRLLVHAASDLQGADGKALWAALRRLRDEGVFRKIGISVYVADDPARLAARFRPDVMQLPFSLLDQRLLADGTLARLSDLGVEVHARSLFLQGLLFLETLPDKLRHAAPHLARLRSQLRDWRARRRWPRRWALSCRGRRSPSALSASLQRGELDEIIAAAQSPLPDLDWASFALHDEMVLTPSLW